MPRAAGGLDEQGSVAGEELLHPGQGARGGTVCGMTERVLAGKGGRFREQSQSERSNSEYISLKLTKSSIIHSVDLPDVNLRLRYTSFPGVPGECST